MHKCKRHFLDWSEPLAPQAASLILSWRQQPYIDFSNTLFVVQSSSGGRALKQALVEEAGKRDTGILSYKSITPDKLWLHFAEERNIASPFDTQLAWTQILLEAGKRDYPSLFPNVPNHKHFDWAYRTASSLSSLKATLAENALNFRSTAERGDAIGEDMARWQDLSQLESNYIDLLNQKKLVDPNEARITASHQPSRDSNISHIILVATCDPMPIACTLLDKLPDNISIDSLIHAPSSEANYFDHWGVPTGEWADRKIQIQESSLNLVSDASKQAEHVSEIAQSYSPAKNYIAISVFDPDEAFIIEKNLSECGIESYQPEGHCLEESEIIQFLKALSSFCKETSFENLHELCSCPLSFQYFESSMQCKAESIFKSLGELRKEHLPETAQAALFFSEANPDNNESISNIIKTVIEWRKQLKSTAFLEPLKELLASLIATRRLSKIDSEKFNKELEAFHEVIDAFDALTMTDSFNAVDSINIIIHMSTKTKLYDAHTDNAIPLLGWLELAWETAPHLILCGFTEGNIPSSIQGDPFLPNSAREKLGIPDNKRRHARDAYLLHSVIASRKSDGQIDYIIPRRRRNNDALVPSRLLMQCETKQLPKRIDTLFKEPSSEQNTPAWQRSWKLKPPSPKPIESVSVTALKDYLECPLRYYFRHQLKMQSYDHENNELDALAFGSICHAVLEWFGRDESVKDSEDPNTINNFFQHELDVQFKKTFGLHLNAILSLQKHNLSQRLRAAAHRQAEEAQKGWRIIATEQSFKQLGVITIGGLSLRGVVDRIDRNCETGEIRVIDYKTSSKGADPKDAHLKGEKWINLQLPLYLHAIREKYGESLNCAYFNLPESLEDTSIRTWHGIDRSTIDSAIKTAEETAINIAEHRFWPPKEKISFDNYEHLFFRGAADSIDSACFNILEEGEDE